MDSIKNQGNERDIPEYKGLYYKNDSEDDHYYEFGAHFPYKLIYDRLENIRLKQEGVFSKSIPSIGFNQPIPQLSKKATHESSNNNKESRNKNPVSLFKTIGVPFDKYVKSINNQSMNQKTSHINEIPKMSIERIKQTKQGYDSKNMTLKQFMRPTNTISNINLNNNANNNINLNNNNTEALNSKTRNALQSIKLLKDHTLQDIADTIKNQSRNKSRNNKELDNRLLLSQCQIVLQQSSNELGGNGSNNSNTVHTSKQNNKNNLITNKKSRNCYKGQLCLSNTHTTNENKSGGTNKTNKTVHNLTNNYYHKHIRTDLFGTKKIYKSLNDKEKKQTNSNKNTKPKVVSVSSVKVVAKTVIPAPPESPYNNESINTIAKGNNILNSRTINQNSSFNTNANNKLNKTKNQSDYLIGNNMILKKYQKKVTNKTLKLLLLTNANNQVIKKDLSITRENKSNLSSSLSQKKVRKGKATCSNTSSILYTSSISKP